MGVSVADLQLEHGLFRVLAHIWDSSAGHEVEEGQDEGGALAQDVVGFTAVGAEVAVVRAVAPPHGLHHGGAQLHGGWEGLGITPWKGHVQVLSGVLVTIRVNRLRQVSQTVPKQISSSCSKHVSQRGKVYLLMPWTSKKPVKRGVVKPCALHSLSAG